MGIETAIIAAIGALASTAFSVYSGIKSSQAQKKSLTYQQAIANNEAQRDRVRAIREGRIQRANALNIAEQVGAGLDSSAVPGGINSVNTRVASNLGFSSSQQGLSNLATEANKSAVTWSSIANTFSAVSNVFGSVYSMTPGVGSLFQGTPGRSAAGMVGA